MTKICIFVNNDMMNDPRVSRHAEALGRSGFTVLVVCMKSTRSVSRRAEQRDFYAITRCEHSYLVQRLIVAREVKLDRVRRERPNVLCKALDNVTATITFLLRMLDVSLKFARVGRKLNADIYASNDLDTLLAGVLSASCPARHVVYDAHELWPDMLVGMGYPSPEIAFFRVMELILVRKVATTITVNEFISAELRRRYGISQPHVILNFSGNEARRTQRRFSSRTIKVALYQGAFIRNRGLENLIRACKFLHEDVELVMRGFGEIEKELRLIAEPFNNCRFDRPVPPDKLVLAASSADVGIVSYLPINLNNYYASPNKLFDCIQAGLPVLVSDLPFLREVVTKNKIGYLFDPRNPEDIARAINRATRSENLRVLKRNVLKIRDRYSWKEEQKKLVDIYRRILYSRIGVNPTS